MSQTTAVLEQQPLSEEQFAEHVRKNGEVSFEQVGDYDSEWLEFYGHVPMPRQGWVVDYGSNRDPEEMVDLSTETERDCMDCLLGHIAEIETRNNDHLVADLFDFSFLNHVQDWHYDSEENAINFWGYV